MSKRGHDRLSFNADAELKAKIDNYRFAEKKETRAEAIVELIESGLEQNNVNDDADADDS